MLGPDFANVRNESESVHFAHVRRHLFTWRIREIVRDIGLVLKENI